METITPTAEEPRSWWVGRAVLCSRASLGGAGRRAWSSTDLLLPLPLPPPDIRFRSREQWVAAMENTDYSSQLCGVTWLLLQRTWVQLPAPHSSQLLVTPASRALTPWHMQAKHQCKQTMKRRVNQQAALALAPNQGRREATECFTRARPCAALLPERTDEDVRVLRWSGSQSATD